MAKIALGIVGAIVAILAALSWPMMHEPVEFVVEEPKTDGYWRPVVVLHVDEPVSTFRYWGMLWDARQRGWRRMHAFRPSAPLSK